MAKEVEIYFVLNGLWNGEDGMPALTTAEKLQADGWYYLFDSEADGVGPFRSRGAAVRAGAEAVADIEGE